MVSTNTNSLTSFIEKMGGDRALRVEENLGQGFVRLRVAEAERRQAKHDIRCSEDVVIEMLRNSRDAAAHRIFLATWREGDSRTFVILDDGQGVPENMRERIFDARVTSKLESVHMDRWGVHGRGMALYSIKENATKARVASSLDGGGTAIEVETDVTQLAEKTDQSSWPTLGTNDEGERVIERGPHNIVRTCCEFALEEHPDCVLYLGSPAEIVATLRSRVRNAATNSDYLFVKDLEELPVCDRFCVASDARELCEVAEGCGLPISERTAHRILSGQIKPLRDVMARLTHAGPKSSRRVDLEADQRGLSLSKDDRDEFSRMMERDFEYLAQRYYLNLSQPPRIRVSGSRVTVSFDFEGED
jgi:hypothetical protein